MWGDVIQVQRDVTNMRGHVIKPEMWGGVTPRSHRGKYSTACTQTRRPRSRSPRLPPQPGTSIRAFSTTLVPANARPVLSCPRAVPRQYQRALGQYQPAEGQYYPSPVLRV
eukprot:3134562-Rhodomonas_salina.1